MEIKINRVARGIYDLLFDKGGVRLTVDDLKELKGQLDRLLAPEETAKEQARHRAFMVKLANADDLTVQTFVRRIAHDDLLALLAASDAVPELKQKLFANMSEKAIKLCQEDLIFKYPDGVAEEEAAERLGRVIDTARKLETDGVLIFAARQTGRPAMPT